MSFRTDHYAALAKTLIAKMEKRHFEAHYCATKKEALVLALTLIPDGASVTHGGCMTIEEIGLVDAVKQGGLQLHRSQYCHHPGRKARGHCKRHDGPYLSHERQRHQP